MEAYEHYSEGEISREEFIKVRDRITAENAALETQKADLEKQLSELAQASSSELHEVAAAADMFFRQETSPIRCCSNLLSASMSIPV